MLDKVAEFLSRSASQTSGAVHPVVSMVVIVHNMPQQAEKTILSLLPGYQVGVSADQYEVIIVENASDDCMRQAFLDSLPGNFRYFLRENPEKSPGPAVNFGAEQAQGDNVCVLIDGARMLTPGVVKNIVLGHRLSDLSVVSVPGYHLGSELQQEAVKSGYNSERERELLDSVGWPLNGYRLFEVACLNASSGLGFFLPNSESNCISVPRKLWDDLAGYDTRFDLPGGGLINLDFYKRACETSGIQHVSLPGEGTFHQFHGGVTTGGQDGSAREAYIKASNQQYAELRGAEYKNPRTEPLYLGEIPQQAQRFVLFSAENAITLEGQECLGTPY